MSTDRLAVLERAYLAARDARDRLDVARGQGEPADQRDLEAAAADTERAVHAALAAFEAADQSDRERHRDEGADHERSRDEDRRALASIRTGIRTPLSRDAGLPVTPRDRFADCEDELGWSTAIAAGGETLRRRIETCYAAAEESIHVGDRTLTRLQILDRLATEGDAAERRRLFLAMAPLWWAVDGDGRERSPYRSLVQGSAAAWRAGRSPIAANAEALGLTGRTIEAWVVALLAAWRAAVVEPGRVAGEPPVEPWDWWWRAGTAQRSLRRALPRSALSEINRSIHAALGADLDVLGIELDLDARPSRPAVPVAFTTFGGRPHQRPDGTWSRGRPTVLATCVDGGLSELAELVHETGHAIHLAAIHTRPAFTDWPSSDALTEALAELVALDIAEPEWQRRWLAGGAHVPDIVSIRCLHAATVLDAAWTLLEIQQHDQPDRAANDIWTEITSRWLGIAPHPEWSWWAIRGQLVQEPGYMANYPIGAILAADLRDAIRRERGSWIDGDPGWYAFVSERIYRFGLERSPLEVLTGVLGRPPMADALLEQIARGARLR